MSLSHEIVHAIRQREKRGLPEEIREKVILHICDTIAISLASYKGAPIALKSIAALSIGVKGGTGRIIGSEHRLPPAYAAFANTALAHALDYDDINDLARIHPTPVTLAAALAAANAEDSRSTDLISAVALGNELLCRLGYAIEPRGTGTDSKWFLSQLFGYLGAAITAGLVLGLDDNKLVHALGLAYMQVAGGKEPGVGTGSQARSIYPAFSSMGGVQAAFLAREGVTAPASSLDGKTGLFPNYFGKNLNEKQRSVLLNTETWAFTDTSIKLYPSCRYSHPYIKAALVLRNQFSLNEIDQIVIGVNETADMLCQPLEDRCHPKTLQDAKFSIPFMVAFAFVHGSVHLNNLTEKALMDTEVLNLTNRLKIEQTQDNTPGIPLGDIKIVTAQETKRQIERILPETPFDEVKKKFIDCCQYADVADPEELWATLSHNLDFDRVNSLPIII
ncbi:MmgE/PrpD family protein [Neobacillus drentensis]|uniref:MmgE/PrpD family protein n=1 Tax=Neobacillus drentensis TaxID=220684 RepID=UPI00285A755B|nr:MmgE/PrpD family protein [Neobacillus drentensis]MDR7239227.1 2-methylcitrate dehydratase PrpD [Neobacillus drentensis]